MNLQRSHNALRTCLVVLAILACISETITAAPETLASFRRDFRPNTPAPGWRYLWNAHGPIGDPLNYTDMHWNGSLYEYDPQPDYPDINPANFLRISSESLHPGLGSTQSRDVGNTLDRYVIMAYLIDSTQPEVYSIIDSGVVRHDGDAFGSNNVRVYVEDDEIGSEVNFFSSNPVPFDRVLGIIQPGSTIYVAIGPNSHDRNDSCNIDFTITQSRLPLISVPSNQTVHAGDLVELSVETLSPRPITYQWQHDGTNIPGATASTLTIPNAQPTDEGDYTVTISDGLATTNTQPAELTVLVNPTILQQPFDVSVAENGTATFSIVTEGTLPMSYRWRRGGITVLHETSAGHTSFLTLTNISAADAGFYDVIITNAAFFVPGIRSRRARLTVEPDMDQDGIADIWETPERQLDPSNPNDAGQDPDGDGVSTLNEHIAGTDHLDGNDFFRFEGIAQGDRTTLQFLARSNRTYTIQHRSSFRGGPWLNLIDLPHQLNTQLLSIEDPLPIIPRRYYRIITPRTAP